GEETAVSPEARKTYGCAGIYNDVHVRQYRRITDFLKRCGAVPAMQLGHAGRKASCRPPWENFAPLTEESARQGEPPWRGFSSSPFPTSEGAPVPKEMGRDDIRRTIEQWREAAF